jgi:hypothetical protein
MKLWVVAVIVVGAAYFADAYYFNGIYFNAFRDVIYHMVHGY